MNHMVIDNETLGLSSSSVILAIGYTVVDDELMEASPVQVLKISLGDSITMGRQVDMGTFRWWAQQNPSIVKKTFDGTLSIEDALTKLAMKYQEFGCERVWSKPSNFDIAMLEETFRSLAPPVPWHYRATRCLRTAYDLLSEDEITEPDPEKKHDVEHDVHTQSVNLISYLRKLRTVNTALMISTLEKNAK